MRTVLVLLAALAVSATALASPPPAKLALRSTSLGSVLVDARGRTLYAFDRDTHAKSACGSGCTSTWPPFLTTGAPVALHGLRASLLGTIKRGDGKLQVAFAGHPLYFFAGDAKAGQVNGAGIAHWAALSATGAKVRPTSGGGGTATTPAPPVYGGGGDGYGP